MYTVTLEVQNMNKLTLIETGVALGITSEAARQLCHRGRLAFTYENGKIRVPQSQVDALLGDEIWRRYYSRRGNRGTA